MSSQTSLDQQNLLLAIDFALTKRLADDHVAHMNQARQALQRDDTIHRYYINALQGAMRHATIIQMAMQSLLSDHQELRRQSQNMAATIQDLTVQRDEATEFAYMLPIVQEQLQEALDTIGRLLAHLISCPYCNAPGAVPVVGDDEGREMQA
ncbi:hypothetical protein NPX13_g3271 [Xylaria arbuscula]|uniref:Uncharacterized protein n=1 Tax=Xylaria arbuscula TaxID=114810 RepID=A0A9W8NIJ0_9PEZI|nr:hypothetical protein NPX13_g3271 [Xylaria arbuscula]